LALTRESFEKIYRYEQNVKTKERMLLVFNVVHQGKVSAQVARDLHQSKAWACEWLKRYDKEGIYRWIKKHRHKSGRPPELSEEITHQIKQELKQKAIMAGPQNRGGRVNHIKKSGIRYHHVHIYRTSFENGVSNKRRCQEKYM
jgi:transposase